MIFNPIRLAPRKVYVPYTISGEPHAITLRDVALHGNYATIYLSEIPYKGPADEMNTVSIAGMVQVDGNPVAANHFHCDYDTGIIYFVPGLDGFNITVDYQGIGTSIDWNTLHEQLDKRITYISGDFTDDYDYQARKFKYFYEATDPDPLLANSEDFVTGCSIIVKDAVSSYDVGRLSGSVLNIVNCDFLSYGKDITLNINCDLNITNCSFHGGLILNILQDQVLNLSSINADKITIQLMPGVSSAVLTNLTIYGKCNIKELNIDISGNEPGDAVQVMDSDIVNLAIGLSLNNDDPDVITIGSLNARAKNIYFGECVNITRSSIQTRVLGITCTSGTSINIDNFGVLYDDTPGYVTPYIININDPSYVNINITTWDFLPFASTCIMDNFSSTGCFIYIGHSGLSTVTEFKFKLGSVIHFDSSDYVTLPDIIADGFVFMDAETIDLVNCDIDIMISEVYAAYTGNIMMNLSFQKYCSCLARFNTCVSSKFIIRDAAYVSAVVPSVKYKIFEANSIYYSKLRCEYITLISSDVVSCFIDLAVLSQPTVLSLFNDLPSGHNNDIGISSINSFKDGSEVAGLNIYLPGSTTVKNMSLSKFYVNDMLVNNMGAVSVIMNGTKNSEYYFGDIFGTDVTILNKDTVYTNITGNNRTISATNNVYFTPDTTYCTISNMKFKQILFTALSNNIQINSCWWDTPPDTALLVLGSDVKYSGCSNIGAGAPIPTIWRGSWSNVITYNIGDEVDSGRYTWVATAANLNSEPPSGNWECSGTVDLSMNTVQIPIEYPEDGTVPPAVSELYTLGTKKVRIRKFSGTADNDVVFDWAVPYDMDTTEGFRYRIKGIIPNATAVAPSPAVVKVVFSLSGYSTANYATVNGVFGAETKLAMQADDTWTAGFGFVSDWSGDVTVVNISRDNLNQLKLSRLASSDADDNYLDDIAITEIEINYVKR